MSRMKGMSQTLALIVAASVLMMTALTVIMMTQGGLEDVFSSSNTQSCVNSVESTCEFANSGTEHNTPDSCVRAGITTRGDLNNLAGGSSNVVTGFNEDTYTCN